MSNPVMESNLASRILPSELSPEQMELPQDSASHSTEDSTLSLSATFLNRRNSRVTTMFGILGEFDILNNVEGEPMDIDEPNPDVGQNPISMSNGDKHLPNSGGGSVHNVEMDVSEGPHKEDPSLDLADKIRGYRLLETISEQASNGLGESSVIMKDHTDQ